MRPAMKFRVRQTKTGWTYDIWTYATGWLLACGDNASEREAVYNAPRAAEQLVQDLVSINERSRFNA